MAGVSFVASSRGTFNAVGKSVTLALPALVTRGDVLVALLAHNAADAPGATPVGWTRADGLGEGADVLDIYVRMVDDNEPGAVAFSFATITSECQGALVAFRGSSPGAIREASASTAFAATATPPTASVTTQQAINLVLSIWTCSGAPALALPAGFTALDGFTTAIVAPRSMLIGIRIAGVTGPAVFPPAVAGTATTGRSFSIAVRARPPVLPAALVDIVPGNIGLIAKDTRRAR